MLSCERAAHPSRPAKARAPQDEVIYILPHPEVPCPCKASKGAATRRDIEASIFIRPIHSN